MQDVILQFLQIFFRAVKRDTTQHITPKLQRHTLLAHLQTMPTIQAQQPQQHKLFLQTIHIL